VKEKGKRKRLKRRREEKNRAVFSSSFFRRNGIPFSLQFPRELFPFCFPRKLQENAVRSVEGRGFNTMLPAQWKGGSTILGKRERGRERERERERERISNALFHSSL